jgi:hypothetical protein
MLPDAQLQRLVKMNEKVEEHFAHTPGATVSDPEDGEKEHDLSPVIPVQPKKRGRPVGWRKKK